MAVIKKFRIKSFKKSESLLELQNVSKSFGERKILDNVLVVQKENLSWTRNLNQKY